MFSGWTWGCWSHSPWVMGCCLCKQLKIWTQFSPQNLVGVTSGAPDLTVQRSGTARLPGRNAGTATVLPAALEHGSGLGNAASRQIPSSPCFAEYLGGLCHLLLLFTPSQPLPSVLYLDHYASAKGSPRRRVLFPLVVSLPVCLTAERQMFGPIL